MTQLIQLDADGYFAGFAIADESPLEPGVFLIPGGCIEATPPEMLENKKPKWVGEWVYEDVPQEAPEEEFPELTYAQKRVMEYPPMQDYLDGIVKNDQAQIDKYIADCLAVKAKYPKP